MESSHTLQNHLKTLAYANRLVLVSLSLMSLTPWVWDGFHHGFIQWPWSLGFGAVCIIHGLMLMANEWLVKTLKRSKGIELDAFLPLCVFIPLTMVVFASANYLISGNLWVYLLGWSGIFQAHCLGCIRLGRLLAVVNLVPLIMGLFIGLPSLSNPFMHGVGLVSALSLSLLSLVVFGQLVAKWVHQYTSELDKLTSMASTDALTGLTNRREFNARLNAEIARARRYNTPLSLALFDLDNFKKLNDVYGHQVGDRILKEMGLMVRQNIRESDLAARYGGEEFALILPETKELDAADLLERLRIMVAQTVFCLPDNPLTVSISVGVAQLNPRNHTSFEFVELADQSLYEAKRQGKNQVIRGSNLMSKVLLDTPLSNVSNG